jgi:signal transduction histidine kinase
MRYDWGVRKVAIIFVLAVLVPSGVLAWLAVRSLQDQELALERQQALILQGSADTLAEKLRDVLVQQQLEFATQVDVLLTDQNPRRLGNEFDRLIRQRWPTAEVGFAVTLDGNLLAPAFADSDKARRFREENREFLSNKAIAQVYTNYRDEPAATSGNQKAVALLNQKLKGSEAKNKKSDAARYQEETEQQALVQQEQAGQQRPAAYHPEPITRQQQDVPTPSPIETPSSVLQAKVIPADPSLSATAQAPTVAPAPVRVRRIIVAPKVADRGRQVTPVKDFREAPAQNSEFQPAETDFRQLIGEASSGALARFLQNKLTLMVWYRSPADPQMVFGAQLDMNRITEMMRSVVRDTNPGKGKWNRSVPLDHVAVALLNDAGQPVALSVPGFEPISWKRPFVAAEVGEVLPHWEVAVYLLDPHSLPRAAATIRWMFALMIGTMVTAILVGGWLILSDLGRELRLARQKTDFVSNVSHELKTPLTSIRMFSELLAGDAGDDPSRRRTYVDIISTEAARLTRLINNVLDFARMERNDTKYQFAPANLAAVAKETADNYRAQLEAAGYHFDVEISENMLPIHGDRDALSQVVLNLLSNAEKYGGETGEIRLEAKEGTTGHAIVRVLDRGIGVPRGKEEAIFEKFVRAHDSLSSGIQGSGLGLTLARQIARAHRGDVTYHARPGGGSAFTLVIPLVESATPPSLRREPSLAVSSPASSSRASS